MENYVITQAFLDKMNEVFDYTILKEDIFDKDDIEHEVSSIEVKDHVSYFVCRKHVLIDGEPRLLEFGYKINEKVKHQVIDDGPNSVARYTNYETGLYNRRYYHEQVKKYPCTGLAFLNIDHLRSINKKYGRLVGDETIAFISQVIRIRLGPDDVGIRYGTNDFMLVFYHLDELAFIERLKDIHNIVQAYTNTQYPDLKLTVSIGGAYRNDIVANLIDTCDDALYEAKQSENALIIK